MTPKGYFATVVLLTIAAAWPTDSVEADTVYDLAPYSLSNGYQLTGTITTDDTVGRGTTDFFRSNIVDYEINVAGPIDFTFTPSNRGAEIFPIDAGLVVTETGIWIEPSDDEVHELRFDANVLGINALNTQQVFWGHGPIGNPASTVGFVAGGATDQGTFRQSPRVSRLLIAGSFSAIPEPTGATLLMSLGLFTAIRRKRRA